VNLHQRARFCERLRQGEGRLRIEARPNCTLLAVGPASNVEPLRGVKIESPGSVSCSRLAAAVGAVIAGTAADRGLGARQQERRRATRVCCLIGMTSSVETDGLCEYCLSRRRFWRAHESRAAGRSRVRRRCRRGRRLPGRRSDETRAAR
jgi:hypothetical protein